jgi:glycosyltransferase involved in cell wall biosynthesis
MSGPTKGSTPKVLLLYDVKVGSEMPALGTRAYGLAKVLEDHADVTLAVLDAGEPPAVDVPCVTFKGHDARALAPHVRRADVVVCQPPWPPIMRLLSRFPGRLIFDIYDPELFPTLITFAGHRSRRLLTALSVDRVLEAFRRGHHIICTNERQRDMWIGAMIAERLLRSDVFDRDPSLRSVIDTVPIAIPPDPPERTGSGGPRERFPQIGPSDEILLWNGGIWDWYDPLTAIRAVHLLAERRPQVRLVFMAGTDVGHAQRATREAHALARELGLIERVVFFNDRWVPYADRADWLLEAECGVVAAVEQLQLHFATATRLLDCLWAQVPIVCTRGEEFGEQVERDDLGETVPPGDPVALADALERVLSRGRDAYSDRLARAAAARTWSAVAEPLVRYVTSGELPPRLGRSLPARLSARPSQRARHIAHSVYAGAEVRIRGGR